MLSCSQWDASTHKYRKLISCGQGQDVKSALSLNPLLLLLFLCLTCYQSHITTHIKNKSIHHFLVQLKTNVVEKQDERERPQQAIRWKECAAFMCSVGAKKENE
ncbi:hypothetical protein XENORESO_000156 [Xenotaenia resolanae]|uniref:Uncharacterized protein n=1 Tax=Xenotaenia resolanae TaxID=208358 RepID=A0ABV0X7H7_9TELE